MIEKKRRLQEKITELTKKDVCIAFSGGVDSSLLLCLATKAAQRKNTTVYAVTISTKLQPREDLEIAKRVAKECGAVHEILYIDESNNEKIMKNGKDRCYWCKKYLFESLQKLAGQWGVTTIMEGSNTDDFKVYRPGLQAVKELGVKSPLAECGITKKEVRAMAQELGLSVANRPSAPCMATRFPYDTSLDFDLMSRLERGESLLKEMGFETVRLRLHGEILRIEIDAVLLERGIRMREEMIRGLKELDFRYITLDLQGFRSGSMDEYL